MTGERGLPWIDEAIRLLGVVSVTSALYGQSSDRVTLTFVK